jgi:hypothetical protein
MKKFIISLTILLLVGSAFASDYRVELKMSYFNPSKQIFKDVYGGGLIYGIKAEKADLFKKFGLILETGYFKKRGKLTFTQEDTTVNIFFIGPGIIYKHTKGSFDIYGGGGFRYYRFKERNPIGHARQGKLGFFLSLGTYIHIKKHFYADLGINYSGCRVNPADVDVQIGGLEVGIGAAYKF